MTLYENKIRRLTDGSKRKQEMQRMLAWLEVGHASKPLHDSGDR